MRLSGLLATPRFRIIATGMLAGAAAALAVGITVLGVAEAEFQRHLLQSERVERERYAALLGGKLDSLKTTLKAVARRAGAELVLQTDDAAAFLLGKPALAALFDNIALADGAGTIVAHVAADRLIERAANIADRDYFKAAMQGDQPVVSPPLLGRVTNEPLVILAAPVPGLSGPSIGILTGSLRLRSSHLLFDGGLGAGSRARDMVIDRQGVLLSHTDPARVLGNAADEPGLREAFARWQADGSPIDTVASVVLDDLHLISMVGVPWSDWLLIRLVPRDEALAPLVAANRAALLAGIAAALLACALAAVLAWTVARPIVQLRDQAQRMIEGGADTGTGWPVQGGEIGAMAQAFRLLLQMRDSQRSHLQALLAQLEAVMDNAEVGLALTRHGRFEMVSRQFCAALRMPREQLVGQATVVIYPSAEAYEAFSARALPEFMAHGRYDSELELRRGDGQVFWARMRGRAVLPGDRGAGTIWVVADATAEKDEREHLSWAASHDGLTGLPNRAAFEQALERATATAAEAPFCALFIDLDRFKQVNDSAGHAAGDEVLRGVARALSESLRQTDLVARLGGDEFAVLLPRCPLPRARELADLLRAAVEGYRLRWEGAEYGVGASIGLVAVDGANTTAADVLRDADAACYAAKRGGRNRVAETRPGHPVPMPVQV